MQPLIFEPYLRPQIWGGRRLGSLFEKKLPDEGTFGESWEISAHPHHVSRVAEGPLKDQLLTEICRRHPDRLFGKSAQDDERFPLLIKLLDCQELLSIQVHPDDDLAAQILGNEKGKTEAWVVLDVAPEGRVYAGLKPGVNPTILREHLEAGTTDQCLHSFKPAPGDCLFLKAGTVHAVGGGVVMAEVQQASDATFRLFDWNRLGQDGNPRKLHVEESLSSIDFSAGPQRPVQPFPISSRDQGISGESLVKCPFFEMDRFFLTPGSQFDAGPGPRIWMVLEGDAQLVSPGYERPFRAGESVLIPVSDARMTWMADKSAEPACLLRISLPS